MVYRIPGRPELVGVVPGQLQTTRPRVLRTEEAATTDAQRVSQANALRTNDAIGRVNQILTTPFGEGETLTRPDGTGGRTELLTLSPGANVFAHTLGRPAKGFAIVDLRAGRSRYVGAWYSDVTQAAAVKDTATPVYWHHSFFEDGITCAPGDYRVVVGATGVYDFQFSLQADKLTGGKAVLFVWCRVSGVDVPWSASRLAIQNNDDEQVPAWNFQLEMVAGDSFELYWATDDVAIELTAYAPTAFCPATTSALLTASGPVGPILTHVERTRGQDERSIQIDASTPCEAKIWVW